MLRYSPFAKPLKELEAVDLAALTQTAEGWYVEYKKEVPNASSIAKSISAFANTYGGWLFYGIGEQSKDQPVAGVFTGIPRDDVEAALQRIRQAAASHVSPSPHFETRAVWGPESSINLCGDRAIICAEIPWSANAPHVHKSGRIYRRLADASEPHPENDRFILDQLWQRAKQVREEYRDWIDREPDFSKGEDEQPYVRLFLVSDLWRDRDAWSVASAADVRAVLGKEGKIIPFNIIYTSAAGFVGRQTQNNDPHNLGLTWFFNHDLRSEVLIPLNFYAPDDTGDLADLLRGHDFATRFVIALGKQGHRSPRIIDLNFLFSVLLGVAEHQRDLMNLAGWSDSYFVKVQLLNVWRTIPFVDAAYILDEFEQNGIPMCMHPSVCSPIGTDPETFVEIRHNDNLSEDKVQNLFQAFQMFQPIALALGLPPWIDPNKRPDAPTFIEELQNAGERAAIAQAKRIAGNDH